MTTNETVPFVDLVGQFHRYEDELMTAIRGVLESASFIGGKPVKAFEAAWADYCGTKNAVGCGNGTDAIYLALRALGVGPGDEVITAVNTFIATSEAITMAGAKPVFVDIDDATALIDASKIEAAITERTKAIIPVHLYGQLVDMKPILAIAEKHGLKIVEDTAQAHGAIDDGKRAGTFGHAATFSFYPGKNLGAYGDGGAVITDDDALAEQIRKIANHGRSTKFGHEIEGVNSRLDGLQAAVLGVKVKHLDTWIDERRAAAARYDRLLAELGDAIVLPTVRHATSHVFHLYVCRVQDRDGLRKHLGEQNIQSGIHYPTPLHLLPAYSHLGQGEGTFPVAEKMAKEIVSLPISPEITEAQQVRVAKAVAEFVGAGR
ncbi:MAG: DegT/DnrJ/EryC1/StrS family aminotransferase [Deltaproteobacteria bacterium]